MRFVHSLLYALFVWIIGVILGSLGSAGYLMAMNGEPFGGINEGFTSVLPLMLIYSAIFSFPAFLVLLICILILNPRKKERRFIAKIILSAIAFVLTGVSFVLFLGLLRDEADEFLPLSLAYFGAVVIAIWVYPLGLAGKYTPPVTESHVTVAQFRSEDEKKWFEHIP